MNKALYYTVMEADMGDDLSLSVVVLGNKLNNQ